MSVDNSFLFKNDVLCYLFLGKQFSKYFFYNISNKSFDSIYFLNFDEKSFFLQNDFNFFNFFFFDKDFKSKIVNQGQDFFNHKYKTKI